MPENEGEYKPEVPGQVDQIGEMVASLDGSRHEMPAEDQEALDVLIEEARVNDANNALEQEGTVVGIADAPQLNAEAALANRDARLKDAMAIDSGTWHTGEQSK